MTKDAHTVSASKPDWSRELTRGFWDPGRQLLKTIRVYQRHKQNTGLISQMICKVTVLKHRFWSVVSGADIPLNSQIAGGLLIPHPNGIVIHPKAKIGPNCLIFQQVTLGSRSGGAPELGGHVDIGAGAKVLGDITLGNHVRIGANAVVMNDVPHNATAVGIPARVITKANTGNTEQE